MIFIWGKRTYGAAEKSGEVSVKTLFGHLCYLPLIQIESYYIKAGYDAAIKLRGIYLRSVLMGFVRGGAISFLLLFSLVLAFSRNDLDGELSNYFLFAFIPAFFLVEKYLYDKKNTNSQSFQIRNLIAEYFCIALDPFFFSVEFARELADQIHEKLGQQKYSIWYKEILNGTLAERMFQELAVLRTRCYQNDGNLQSAVVKFLSLGASTQEGWSRG